MAFLKKLDAAAVKHSVTIVAYVLMPNHYHLLVIQNKAEGFLDRSLSQGQGNLLQKGGIPDMMEALGTSTAKRYNLKYGQCADGADITM